MDLFVQNLLKEWGLEILEETFKNQGVDETAMELLDDSTIKELIPQIGLRLKFGAKFKNYFHKEVINLNFFNSIISIPGSTSSSTTLSLNEENIVDFINEASNNNVFYDENFALAPVPIPIHERPPPELEPLPGASVFPLGLEDFLNKSLDGKSLLRKKNQILSYSERQKIASLTVDHLFHNSTDHRISASSFLFLAREISYLFLKEISQTYYIPYKKKSQNSPKILARGKLWSRYINLKFKYKDLLTESNEKESSVSVPDTDITITESEADIEIYINYLKHNIDPYETIETYFKKTFKERVNILRESDPYQYMNAFPALKQGTGYKLLLNDFNQLYPTKTNNLFSKWPAISQKIIKIAREKNKLDKDIFNKKFRILCYNIITVHVSGNNNYTHIEENKSIEARNPRKFHFNCTKRCRISNKNRCQA